MLPIVYVRPLEHQFRLPCLQPRRQCHFGYHMIRSGSPTHPEQMEESRIDLNGLNRLWMCIDPIGAMNKTALIVRGLFDPVFPVGRRSTRFAVCVLTVAVATRWRCRAGMRASVDRRSAISMLGSGRRMTRHDLP